MFVRRGAGGQRVERGEGLIAAAYRHRMSRALDPQLHTHVVAANLARGPRRPLHGAAWRAALSGGKTAGYLYQSHLRALVRERLGLEWGEVHKGAAELAACRASGAEQFSKRRAQRCSARPRRAASGLETKAVGGDGGARDPRAQAVWDRDAHLARGDRARAPRARPRRERARRAARARAASARAPAWSSAVARTSERSASTWRARGSDRAREHVR